MPVDKTLIFGQKPYSEVQPPLLEKIISQYQEIFCLQIGDYDYPAAFTPEGKFLSFKGSSRYHLDTSEDKYGDKHSAILQELGAGYLGSGLISYFFADLLYDNNKTRYALVIPTYSPKTGRIIKLYWNTNDLGKETPEIPALKKSRIIYRTTSEVLADLVMGEK